MATTIQGFEARHVLLDGIELFVRRGGRRGAPALLLLHGYPQTGAIWRRVAERLAGDFELLIPDLRGYGASSKPPGVPDHANYSKRAMADDVARLMTAFGHERVASCEHRPGEIAERRRQALEAVMDDSRPHAIPRPLDYGTIRSIVMLTGRAEAKS